MSLSSQFLNTVLSQGGTSALPYDMEIKWLIRQHLVTLVEEFQTLSISTSIFNHNDGTSVNLLNAQGTIPMVYQKVTYHIPITIWLLESYCRRPPLVYVTPTSDMVFKRQHPFVDASGLVSSPYLVNWVFPSSNLVDMVNNLTILFGQTPPLFTKQNAARALKQLSHVGGALGSHSNMSSSHGRPHNPTGNSIPPPQQHDNQKSKKETINKLVELFQNDMAELKKRSEREIDGIFSMQEVLRLRGDELDKGLGELQEEKENLEQQLQSIFTCIDVLATWLHDNNTQQSNFEIEDAVETCDVLSKQLMESSSADLAIEDIFYSLDKAVQDGAIPVEAYLKNVRTLSREQFFHRATAEKVRTTQAQGWVATNMATRVGNYIS